MRWRNRFFAIAFGLGVAIGIAELTLRLPELPLRPDLSTALFQCYGSEYEDENVAFESPKLEISVLKPNVDVGCAWNGYRWHHHGDRYGYRNPYSVSQADLVLLGDSMTYGHGVEETSTAAHFLRQELGRTVVNLGWMGDSPIQYVARLRNYALPLHPLVVVVFFFQNDFDDILAYRSPDAIRRFVANGEGSESGRYSRDELAADCPPAPTRFGDRIGEHLLTFRVLRFLSEPHPRRPVGPEPPFVAVPPLDEEVALEGSEQLAVDYLGAASVMMAASAREAGVRLVFSVIPTVGVGRNLQLVRQRVCAASKAVNVPFLDLIGKFAIDGRLEQRGDYLARDGHLSEQGHRRVAREVAAFIREQRLLGFP